MKTVHVVISWDGEIHAVYEDKQEALDVARQIRFDVDEHTYHEKSVNPILEKLNPKPKL